MEKLKEKGVTDSEEDCTRRGQARHEVISSPLELHVEESKEKAVTDSGEDEQDNRGERKEGDEPKLEEIDEDTVLKRRRRKRRR